MGVNTAGVVAVALVVAATLLVGSVGLRLSRTTSDFYVASRTVGPRWNASAIGGEYLSAASFLGIAGLVLAFGADMLWFGVGYTAGYVVLLVLVAAPLRRSGAYTLPDFAHARTGSAGVRRCASVLVVAIGWLYLLPQFQGAGLALRTLTGAPTWAGGALVAVVVALGVLAGGMRSITFVQAFQFWLKLTAIAVPAVAVLLVWNGDGRPAPDSPGPPVARQDADLTVTEPVTVEGRSVAPGETVRIEAGAPVPHADGVEPSDGPEWAAPASGAGGREHPLYATWSLLLALCVGTMGLPHVLVRFYTNPDGRAARRTTMVVVALLGLFYLWPAVYGALGRVYTPDLLTTGRADTVVLELPARLLPEPWGALLGALTIAGAFAAFLSTSSGLTVSVAGVLHQGLPGRGRSAGVAGFRWMTVVAVAIPLALSLLASRLSLADTVGLAFAVAGSTFCPLLVLGIWWPRLSSTGAVAGLVVGGTSSAVAVLASLVSSPDAAWTRWWDGWVGALISQPAAWTVPLAFAVTVAVSLATPHRVPEQAGRLMARLHTPEARSGLIQTGADRSSPAGDH